MLRGHRGTVAIIGLLTTFAALPANAQRPADRACCSNSSTIVAVIDGRTIHSRDVDDYARTATRRQLFELNRQLNDYRTTVADSMAADQLLEQEAARQGRTAAEVVQALRVEAVSDSEIVAEIQRINAGRAAGSRRLTIEEHGALIRTYLEGKRRSEARGRYIQELKAR